MKKTITTSLIIIAFLFGFYKLTSKKPASIITPDSDIVLFYGDTCPHCKDVEEFISKNQIDQKVKISRLEVYRNENYSALLNKMVKEVCPEKLDPQGLPVPFMINSAEKKCFIGTPDITGYLTEKAK